MGTVVREKEGGKKKNREIEIDNLREITDDRSGKRGNIKKMGKIDII